MTDSPAPTQTEIPPAAPSVKSKMPLVALILAGVGFLFAIFPATAGIVWLLAIPAIILAIISLARNLQPRGLAVAAVIVAPVAWLIAIIVAVGSIAGGVSAGLTSKPDTDQPAASAAAPAEPSAAPSAAPDKGGALLGQTVTNNKGVAVTFTAVTCGLASAGPEFLTEQAKGQFCEVRYTVKNDGKEKISLFSSDVTGEIGGIKYDSDGTVSTFGGDYFTTDLNPGLGTDAVVYIDIPADKALDYVVFVPQFSLFTDEIKVKVS